MSNVSVDVRTGVDGSVVVQPHGAMGSECAVQFQQVLVHAVRKVRPYRLVLDLGDVSDVDPINLGVMAALCDVADDHHVAVFLENSAPAIAMRLRAAGVPPQRFRPATQSRADPVAGRPSTVHV